MNQFDQHTAMMSLEQALVPTAGLVDSRTEADNLRLLVDIASLFNFYDQTNKINGNWSPFLLKDPVFLVASIAKTSFQKAYSLFINTCLKLEKSLQTDLDTAFISNAFNQLFDQLTYIFHTIERWTYYMQQSSLEYNLKTYIIQQVKEKQSALLWALLALKSDLNINGIIPNINPVDTFAYENYDKKIWKESKGKQPYWVLLNLKFSPEDDYIYYFFKDFITLIEKLAKLLQGSFSAISKEISTILEAANTALTKTLDLFFSMTEPIAKKVIEFTIDLAEFVHTIIHKIREEVKEKLKSLENKDVSDAVQNILADFDALQDSIKGINGEYNYQDFKKIVTAILKALKTIVIDITELLLKFGESIFKIIQEIFEVIATTFIQIAKDLYDALKAIIGYILTKQVRQDIYNGIKGTGKSLFAFYSNCISYAETELESVQNVPGHFPDTILLRTFTSLLKIYQAQLNSLSEKHLNFYYGDILKQLPKSVSPDTVFAASDLAKKTATFQLPKNTVFTAGLDANKQAILFETTNTVSLNPAKIVTAYTLAQANDTSLYLQKLPPVNVVAKDEDGTIKSWKTFGSQTTPEGAKQYMALTLGSPMFFLAEANTRTITVTFTLSNSNPSAISENNTVCYFSTKDAWFEIPENEICVEQNSNIVTLTITLAQTDPAITAFSKNPDGYTSEWPLLKMVFLNIVAIKNPTTIETLDIAVNVTGAQNFVLYNDFGQLNAKKPFQLLGPTPTVDQSFMVGSAEIFSKPASDVKIHLTWNTFPAKFDFAAYYCQYNNYANGFYNEAVTSGSEDQSAVICPKKVTETPTLEVPPKPKKVSFLDRIRGKKPETLVAGISSENTPTLQFTNDAFKVSFDFLENGLWNPVGNAATDQELFTKDRILAQEKTFEFPNFQTIQTYTNPALQKTPLTLTDKSITGFLKMQLTAPDVGFGTAEYPNVVGAIALYNAGVIAVKIKHPSSKLVMIQPPNIPFIPTVSFFSVDYNASVSYDFSNTDETYPLECFYNTPFENYKVYDTIDGIITQNTTIGSSPKRNKSGTITPLTALPLVPKFSSKGQLFLELQDVIAPANVSFYFELARTYTEKAVEKNKVSYSYLSTDGWKTLTSIADGTNGFTCSGIITINIPADITTNHETMAGNNFWIAIGAKTAIDNFPQTSFLKTNGITLQRIVSPTDFSTEKPQIKANVITSPETAIPEILATVQPFASFDGKAAETNQQMNSRVSTRLKTKDRLVTAEDFFNVIRLEFSEVYYSKTIYKKAKKQAYTYVIKRVSEATETNAFVPLLSECNELEIQKYIKERVSPFVKVSVENFKLNYVKITADIKLNSNEDVTTVSKEINNDINIYLAPWITSTQTQITVDTGLNTAQLASFINSYDSVLEVISISLQVGTKDFTTGKIIYNPTSTQEIAQKDGMILVPSLNNITENTLIKYHL